METILITGVAGFIGFSAAKQLLKNGEKIVGIDNLNNYYDVNLKKARLAILKKHENFLFHKIDISNLNALKEIFYSTGIDRVCHLAAQAGVRYSLVNPFIYENTNVKGFLNIIDLAKERKVKNFVYASSSSVYGTNEKRPYSESDNVDHPVSLYAATKKATELIAHAYSHLYKLPTTGLRFFTVYGPWGRPDMALYRFTKSIYEGKPIEIYNYGKMKRDFTYINDIVSGLIKSIYRPFAYEIINLGNHQPTDLMYFVQLIEKAIGKTAQKKLLPLQPGDVISTYADITKAKKLLGFEPVTSIETGIPDFVEWYKMWKIGVRS